MKKDLSQSGRSIIEIMGVLTVIGLLTVSIAKTITGMMERYKNSRITMQLTELQKGIQNRFAIDSDFTKLSSKLIMDEKLAPSDIDWKDNTMYHKFHGSITVGHNYTSTVLDIKSGQSYWIQFNKVPQQACLDLMSIDWSVDQYSDLITIISGDLQAYWRIPQGASAEKSIQMPISVDDALKMCSSKSSNKLRWVFQ